MSYWSGESYTTSVSIRENGIESNKLSDLEVAELSIFVTQQVISKLIPDKYENLRYILTHLTSVPDLAVKFADTVVKSTKNGSIDWSEVAEIFGAAATLTATLGKLAGLVNPWVTSAETAQQWFFLIKDLTDSGSPPETSN